MRAGAGGAAPADLRRLPVIPDLRAASIAEGMRAALATAVLVAANEWFDTPLLTEAALAAMLACLCDAGGPVRRRVPSILAFAVLGGLITALAGLAHVLPAIVTALLSGLAVFLCLFARSWNPSAMQVGNLLSVALVLGLDHALDGPKAAVLGVAFAGGAVWSLLLTAVIWRIRPHRPVQRAVAEAYRRLALLAADLRGLVARPGTDEAEWEAHARAHRRAVRIAIEAARTAALDAAGSRGPGADRIAPQLLRLETADQLFGSLIALSGLLEGHRDPVLLDAADRLLRLLRPMLVVLGDAILHDALLAGDRLERPIAAIAHAAGRAEALRPLGTAMAERLRVAATLAAPNGTVPGRQAAPVPPWRDRLLGPLRSNLTMQSTTLRHALRAAVVVTPALLLARDHMGSYGHWMPIATLMVLQPFFATTWQRAVERIGGTVLGGMVAAGLGVVCTTPAATAAAMFPLAMIAFGMRPMSYGLFMVGYTPLIVLLSEIAHSGAGWELAGLRALFTLAGGLLAVAGCVVLWPSWEPDRVRRQVRAALLAHADYAEAVLGTGEPDAARRRAGLASNELEVSLARALQEPRREMRRELEPAMTADASLRRVAGRLLALRLDPAWRPDAAWAGWVAGSLRGLADGRVPVPRPAIEPVEPLARIARQVELLAGVLRR